MVEKIITVEIAKATIPRETGRRNKAFKKSCMQWHDTRKYTTRDGHRDLETESAQRADSLKILNMGNTESFDVCG